MSEVCPFLVAVTVHVPASGSVSTHEPFTAVPLTLRVPFVAVTREPVSTVTTRENCVPALPTAFVRPIAIFYTAFIQIIEGIVIAAVGLTAA